MTLRHALYALVPTLVVVVLAGIAAEVYLRWDRAQVRAAIERKVAGRERCTQASFDPVRIYEGIPGKCGNNALGFRDRDHALVKSSGTFRVAIIGDSVALGQGVRADEAFARVLEARLRGSGIDAEVVLFAVTGYSTAQEFSLLDLAFGYRPDLIVWAYALNDPADPVFDNANGEPRRVLRSAGELPRRIPARARAPSALSHPCAGLSGRVARADALRLPRRDRPPVRGAGGGCKGTRDTDRARPAAGDSAKRLVR